ncbi:hypothetical protein NNO_0712 [Hydrogenimonas sp.]|nr:hypothetical protein NNO_0712 [Hydrogenimonas sp.]
MYVGLELYAKIEPLLGFEEEIESLYGLYIEILSSWKPKSLVDIGCGSGKFLLHAQKSLSLNRSLGVDLSETMVERAKQRGVEALAVDICDLNERFEAATAVFDVLNYLDESGLKRFMGCVEELLEPGGIFIADINTLYGFEEISQGALVKREKESLLALESAFENGRLKTYIDYFRPDGEGCYRREEDCVVQYFHSAEKIAGSGGLELIQIYPVTLYGDEPDKEVLLFRKKG